MCKTICKFGLYDFNLFYYNRPITGGKLNEVKQAKTETQPTSIY